MNIKRIFALLLSVALICTFGLVVGSAETDLPSEDRLLWTTHYNDGTVEGAGVIFTQTDTAGGWWIHVAFKPSEIQSVYEITDITNGLSDGSATTLAVPEGGFVWAANYGNDYASMEGGGINYTSENCNSAIGYALTWKIGERYTVHGVDFSAVPTSTPELKWYDSEYICTATIAPYRDDSAEADPVTLLQAKLSSLVGEDAPNAVFAWEMNGETDEEGQAVLTLTVSELAGPAYLQNVYGRLVYDHEALTLVTEVGKDNLLDCIETFPGENWENMCCVAKDDDMNVIPGELDMGAVNATDQSVISAETPLVLTLRFQLNEGYDLAGVYIATESVFGNDNEMTVVEGNGAYAILQRAKAPEISQESSEDSSEESSQAPKPGDEGIVWFILLGFAALIGVFAAWKARHLA